MTTTTLPDLSSDYPLSPEQIEAFGRDGHVLLRGVLSPEELAPCRDAIRNATDGNIRVGSASPAACRREELTLIQPCARANANSFVTARCPTAR